MHKGLYNRIYRAAENEGGGSTGQGSESGKSDNPDTQKGNGHDKAADSLDNFMALWDAGNKKGGGDNKQTEAGSNNTGAGNNNNNQSANSETTRLDEYLNGQNYFAGVDLDNLSEAIRQGNAKAVMEQFQKALRNLHQTTMRESLGFAKNYSQKAIEDAVKQSSGIFDASQAYNALFSKYPDLKHKAIAPMAKAVFKRQLAQSDNDVEKAVEMTNTFFNLVGKQFYKPPKGGPGARFGGTGNVPDEAGEEINYDEFFTTE